MKTHSCEPQYKLNHGSYGCAVTWCAEKDNGEFWAGNDEYCNNVPFCPFCGQASPVHLNGITKKVVDK